MKVSSRTSSAPHRAAKLGRPVSFDREQALEAAMLLFWTHGFEATSLSALTAAMGLSAPSIYAAFGDKKHLFLAAVDRYIAGPRTAASIISDAATAREAAHLLLAGSALAFTGTRTPRGCLLASATVSCSADAQDVQRKVAKIRMQIEVQLRKKISADIRTGELPASTNAAALAAHTMAIIQGMSTLARDGASRQKLSDIATLAMHVWPGK